MSCQLCFAFRKQKGKSTIAARYHGKGGIEGQGSLSVLSVTMQVDASKVGGGGDSLSIIKNQVGQTCSAQRNTYSLAGHLKWQITWQWLCPHHHSRRKTQQDEYTPRLPFACFAWQHRKARCDIVPILLLPFSC